MTRPLRHNPLADVQGTGADWTLCEHMPVVARFTDEPAPGEPVPMIGDLSFLPRFGCKGPGALAWLAQAGLPQPPAPNTWAGLPDGGLIVRLGVSEFLIEDVPGGHTCARLAGLALAPGVYPVPRQDASLLLAGRCGELLLQSCALNFAAFDPALRPVALTSMVGVAVVAMPLPAGDCRLWCDASYGAYLWQTLAGVAADLGGGPIGLDAVRARSLLQQAAFGP